MCAPISAQQLVWVPNQFHMFASSPNMWKYQQYLLPRTELEETAISKITRRGSLPLKHSTRANEHVWVEKKLLWCSSIRFCIAICRGGSWQWGVIRKNSKASFSCAKEFDRLHTTQLISLLSASWLVKYTNFQVFVFWELMLASKALQSWNVIKVKTERGICWFEYGQNITVVKHLMKR